MKTNDGDRMEHIGARLRIRQLSEMAEMERINPEWDKSTVIRMGLDTYFKIRNGTGPQMEEIRGVMRRALPGYF